MTRQLSAQASIVQFGTSRFLLGHVAAFVSVSLAAGHSDQRILVVQTSSREEGKRKARALATQRTYPLHLRGRRDGRDIDEQWTVDSVADAVIADEEWHTLERHFVAHATHVVSNTADAGYVVGDDSSLAPVPASFPGKLTKLLKARHAEGSAGLILLPCELVTDNGQRLKALVVDLARRDYPDDAAFLDWLETECLWANTLVDRIVSAALEPVGALAEPYALWAIEEQPGLTLPCRHPDVIQVDDLTPFAMRKLHLLNLSHTYLVHRWQQAGRDTPLTFVREAMADPALYHDLKRVIDEEVIPALATRLERESLVRYRDEVFERFANPYLDHRLADIAQNHAMKCQRRIQPVIDLAEPAGIATPGLHDAMQASDDDWS
ncbi:mannitol dehydrogenase [Halomonas sp. McH1-25]|uniref:mannitol dehydrogenase family protein n=1 Tax=unclassified Halomonas TaxID=2609666 RepID=UPI001EF52922|nr:MULTISPECIES: mannitol dehydrogenase [unclassified Halomonas]MCG7601539.1 mannitol dehydrogenase [Halomonas sp. McH1-25]MCP1343337.1 mannitol dehydrogenase [Halomonas sp. FL8]MCP1362576.1 mannitol dehydrogenase [Halomonas sp. BBD45]